MFGAWNPSQFLNIVNATSAFIKKATGFGALQGILCGASSSLVVQIWDTTGTNATAGAVRVSPVLSLTAGQSYPIPAKITQGLYVQVVSGSGDFTVFFD